MTDEQATNEEWTSEGDGKTYEMMWDCRYCGQNKNLAKSHRCCPNCGGPQDPEARYFPSDDEKVAVEDHEFVGSDLACPACQHPNSKAASCCANCGSPLSEGKGCERTGKRREKFLVRFSDKKSGDTKTCTFSSASRWKKFRKGSKWKGKASGLTGNLDCSGLKRRLRAIGCASF